MTAIKEYLAETNNFNKKVENLTDLLNDSSLCLNELATKLEEIFELLKRGNNLITFLKNYSKSFEAQIADFGEALVESRRRIGSYQEGLSKMEVVMRNTREITSRIEENANNFIKSARMIAYLAENIQVKAHQSKEEGRGLAVIAEEVFRLARSSQVPFQHFDEFLEVIRKNIEPLLENFNTTIKDAAVSLNALMEFLSSFKAMGESMEVLKKFIMAMEEGGKIFSELEIAIKERLQEIKSQLSDALMMIDEISTRGSEIHSLSNILNELSNIVGLSNCTQSTYYSYQQYRHLLKENINLLKRLEMGVPPSLSSQELAGELGNIVCQTNRIYETLKSACIEVDNLSGVIDKIADIRLNINEFFSSERIIAEKIGEFRVVLKDQLDFMENLIAVGSKIIAKIKTLSVFSRLEQSRSSNFKTLITPIVEEFINLSEKLNSIFMCLDTDIYSLRQILGTLEGVHQRREFIQLPVPDFSKIKIFFDDALRVFENCVGNAQQLKGLAEMLNKDEFLLTQHWNIYEQSMKSTANFQASLQQLLSEDITAPEVVKERKTIRINLLNEPVTLKPDLKTDATSQQVIVNYSVGLFQFGFGTNVIFGLCDEYTISPDGREYILHIREDLKYANGKKLHIEDIKNGIIRGLCGPNHNLLEMIAGGDAFLKSKNPDVLSVKIIDPHRLHIRLQYPYLPFQANLATNIADPYLDGELPVGTGPFRLVEWNHNIDLKLVANDSYFEGRPAFDMLQFLITPDEEIAYELYTKGELAIYQPGHKSLHKIREEMFDQLITTPELSVQFLCLNCQVPPFNNKLVRKAICHAINTEKFVNDLLAGMAIPARGVFPPSMPVYNKRLAGYRYDLARSRELLSQAGFEKGLPDTCIMDVSNTPASVRRAEFVRDSLSEIGIRIEINPLPWHDFLEKTYHGNFLLCLQGWISDSGDPDNFLYPLFHTNSFGYAGNTFFFSNREIDEMIEQARQIRNIKQRWNYYRQIEERILDEAPGAFLFHTLKNLVVRKGVRGFKPNPLSIIRAKYMQSNIDVFLGDDIFSRNGKPQLATV